MSFTIFYSFFSMRYFIEGNRYDSLLEIRGINAKLTLLMRMDFVAVDGNSSTRGRLNIRSMPLSEGINGTLIDSGGRYPLIAWTDPTELFTLRENIKRAIEDAWNNKYWLIPRQGWYRGDHGLNREFLPVECSVQINYPVSRPHFTAYCIKPTNTAMRGSGGTPEYSEYFRSYVTHTGGAWGVFTKEDAERQLTEVVTKTTTGSNSANSERTEYYQVTAAHEFSHIIGLDHVNGEGNQRWRYGRNDRQRRQISGMGMEILPHHMRAWVHRMNRHIQPLHIRWNFDNHPHYIISNRI
jgi:hypothetical protein